MKDPRNVLGSDANDWVEIGRTNYQEGRAFEERVAELYRLLNYDVEHGRLFSGRQVDIFLTGRFGDLRVHRAIECKAGKVRAEQIDSFLAKLRLVRHEFPATQGTIVSDESFTDAIAAQAGREGIQLTLFRDLEAELFDGHAYAQRLLREIESSARYPMQLYVEPRVGYEASGEEMPAFEIVKEWLEDSDWNQLTLLGDVGTGKSFLTRMVAYRLVTRFLRRPRENPLPILVDLRNADRQFSLEGLIVTHLSNSGVARASFEVFQYALAQGDLVLILDGFDEMAARVTPQITLRNFHELARSVVGRAKVLLTCRTHYFKTRTEAEEVVLGTRGAYESDTARDLYWELIARKGFRISYLRPFSRAQIEQYVRRVKGDTAEAALRKLRNTYNLMELSQRPMLLDMIVRSLDRITTDEINAATLYQIYTDAWIHRDQWRDILSPEAKLALLTALGRTLWTQDMVSIHYSQLAEYLQSELATQIQNVHHFVEIDSEVRTATFLTRDDQGNYGFAHKSYSEYFVARHIAGELSHQRTGVLSTRRLSPEIIGFLRYMVDREAVESILENLLRSEYRPIISENAVLCLYGFRRGALLETSTDDTSLETRLIVEMPEGLRLCGAQFDQVSLEGACLRNANLAGANLSEATLAGIDLSGSDVSSASFDKAVLSHALLRGCNCRDAVFSGADLEHAVLEGSDFSRADLSDAYLASADCTGITWTEAKLVGAILPNGLDASVTEYWDIVESLRPWMLEMVQSQVTPEEVDEEDVVSDVVMALVQPRYIDRVITLEDRDRRSFVASVMINVLAAHRRMARREISFDLVDHAAVEASLEAAYSSYSPGHSFEERLSVDSSRLFERLAELLAHDTYKIVSLRFESNLGIAKIAEIMGISTRTVQRHLRKAGEIARKQLLLPPI